MKPLTKIQNAGVGRHVAREATSAWEKAWSLWASREMMQKATGTLEKGKKPVHIHLTVEDKVKCKK